MYRYIPFSSISNDEIAGERPDMNIQVVAYVNPNCGIIYAQIIIKFCSILTETNICLNKGVTQYDGRESEGLSML